MNLPYETQYMNNLYKILTTGKREKNKRTGIETFRIPFSLITVDLNAEFPILKSRYINWKIAAKELFWIFQKNSNNINELDGHIWDKWADSNGSIGKTYGYQVGIPTYTKEAVYKNQVDYVLDKLQQDHSFRQAVIDMWNCEDLAEMSLPPCVYSSIWSIIDGKLNCMVIQRSADYPVGVPFDTTQYAILTHLFARHLHVKPGILTHVMADSHIYINQVDGVEKLLDNYKVVNLLEIPKFRFGDNAPDNFWQMTIDDIFIDNYHAKDKIKFEVAK